MNLHRLLQRGRREARPLRVALIGAGKFGSMYLAQAKHTPGIHLVAIADLAPDRAHGRRSRASAGRRSVSPRARSPTPRTVARRSSPTTRSRVIASPRDRDRDRRDRATRPPASATRSRAASTASTS